MGRVTDSVMGLKVGGATACCWRRPLDQQEPAEVMLLSATGPRLDPVSEEGSGTAGVEETGAGAYTTPVTGGCASLLRLWYRTLCPAGV